MVLEIEVTNPTVCQDDIRIEDFTASTDALGSVQ